MIEQVNGSGLPGATGKSSKQTKNGLFSKLLSMLEKSSDASGKGKELQLNSVKSGKAKSLPAFAVNAESVVVAKSKNLLTMAGKEKSQGKEKTDDAAASMLAAHVIINSETQVKKSNNIGNVSILIAGQVAGQAAGANKGQAAAQLAEQTGGENKAQATVVIAGVDKVQTKAQFIDAENGMDSAPVAERVAAQISGQIVGGAVASQFAAQLAGQAATQVAGQAAPQIAGQAVAAGRSTDGSTAQFTTQSAGRFAQRAGVEGAEKSAFNRGTEKLDQGAVVSQPKVQVVSRESGDLIAAQPKGDAAKSLQGLQSDMAVKTSSKATIEGSAFAQKSSVAEQSVKAGVTANPVRVEMAVANSPEDLAKNNDVNAAVRSGFEEKKSNASMQNSFKQGKKVAEKLSAEGAGVVAGAAVQQAKVAQSQQVQQPSSTSIASSGSYIVSSDASTADSGSQSSDNRGGQGSQSLTGMLGDAKSTSSSASTNAHFQSYLTNKSTPVMSVFDSMNHIAQSAKNGQTRLEIQLDPGNLGKIQISLQSDANKQLQVHMIVDQSMTRSALEQQLPQLRSALAQQGFDLSGFSMDSQGQQASSGGDGSRAQSNGGSNHAEAVMADSQATQPQKTMTGSGLSIRV